MSTPMVVDIWSDVMCPWCLVGWRSFMEGARLASDDVEVTIRWMPFELNPKMPPEGKLQAEHLASTYNRSAEEIEAMRAELSGAAERVGFPIDWQGEGEEPPAMMWNTFDCHKLLRWALAAYGPAEQTTLKEAMFSAHFQQRRNMANRDVLVSVCEEAALDGAKAREALDDEALELAVRAEEERGVSGGISAVPTFVVNHKYMLQGAQEPENFARALLQIAGMEAAA
ncbi:DsbA family oxidoreductase [Aurantiacibacter rhizosphaerae]|uniref:Thioredoxin domain-containing protein n=1 Tax=Aurantiacibacter rhizosphaerae TaxID=2691582 RepID=A0A844XFH2_9SPHN|nr:DsbA family oxidoreductase [Aurantiacibacter rhizosphaerae]MWV28489.1 thioredoxin domain-containing protein [Aurantiacibacter rhizosphaerae]